MSAELSLVCLKHKNYKAKRYPTSGCKACRFIYEVASGAGALLDSNTLYNLYVGRMN